MSRDGSHGAAAVLRQFFAFTGVGALGTAAHYATLIAAVALGANAVLASGLGATVGAIVNYLLNYHVTFRSRMRHRQSAARFALMALSSIALNTLLMALLVERLRWHYLVAQVAATGMVLCWNFAVSRLWVFSEGRSRPLP